MSFWLHLIFLVPGLGMTGLFLTCYLTHRRKNFTPHWLKMTLLASVFVFLSAVVVWNVLRNLL